MRFDFAALLILGLVAASLRVLLRRGGGEGTQVTPPPGGLARPDGEALLPLPGLRVLVVSAGLGAGLALLLPAVLVFRRHVYDGQGLRALAVLGTFSALLVAALGSRWMGRPSGRASTPAPPPAP